MVARVCVCLSVCLSAAACLYYYTDPVLPSGSGRRCPLVVHYWADLQKVHELLCYGNCMKIRGRASGNFPRTSALTFTKHKGEESPRSRCGDVVTRTRNISEYIFVLTQCSVLHLRIANILFK